MILKFSAQCHVFPATFHVIYRKIYFLWDSGHRGSQFLFDLFSLIIDTVVKQSQRFHISITIELSEVYADPQKKIKDRGKDKGRCFCLGERIYSIPCRAVAILYQNDFEEQDEIILVFKSSRCNSCYFSIRLSACSARD